MGIEYFFTGLYLLLILWRIPKFSIIKNSGLSTKETYSLFLFKLLIGIAAAVYFAGTTSNADYLAHNFEGNVQYHLLLSHPYTFFTDITADITTYGFKGIFASEHSFWAYLRFSLLYKILALVNLISRGNFYLNTVIFSSIVFFGHIAFYNVFGQVYINQKLKILVACFCIPSLMMYTACFHKDGIIFLSAGMLALYFFEIVKSSQPNLKYWIGILLILLVIFLFRNYVVVALLPAMLTALACKKLKFKTRWIVIATYTVFGIGFFLSAFAGSLSLPAAVVQRKADFANLPSANTEVPMNLLEPTFTSFLTNLPQALNHSIMRPYLWEFSGISVVFAAIELFIYQLLFILFLFYRKKNKTSVSIFNIFGLALFLNMVLIIGYTIPNIGAIVRYRSIFWIFIVCPVLCNIDFKKIGSMFCQRSQPGGTV